MLELARLASSRSVAVAGRILADLGADVLVISPGASAKDRMHRGKRLVRAEQALETLGVVIDDVDVVLFDLDAQRWMEASGLGAAALESRAPDVVFACISPFGLTGPWRDLAGGELIVQAAASILSCNGSDGDPPLPAGIPIAAYGSALLAAIAILAALYERLSSGRGQLLDQSEYDSLVVFSGTLLPSYFLTKRPLKRLGNRHAMASPWNSYRTRDSWVVLCTMNDTQFEVVARAIGRAELLVDARFSNLTLRVANAPDLDRVIGDWAAQLTTKQAVEVLERAGVATAAIRTVAELLRDPHARWRGVVASDGESDVSGPFLRFSGTLPGAPPAQARDDASTDARSWTKPRFTFPPRGHREGQDPREGGRPLSGVHIVELAAHTAGPLAGRLLGMLGADVVKVEPPSGEATRHLAQQVAGQGYLFHLNNTDKLDCTLDMDSALGRSDLMSLVGDADAFLTNISTDTLASWSAGAETLVTACPHLVYCGLTGFGGDGPYGGRRAFDMVVQAMSGIMSLTSSVRGEPQKIAISVVDVFGACSAAIGTIAALLARRATGTGQVVDVSLFDVAVWSTQDAWDGARQDQVGRPPEGRCLPTADGFIALTPESMAPSSAFAKVVEQLAPGPSQGPAELGDLVARTRLVSGARLEAACWAQGIPAFIPRQLHEVANAPHTEARALLTDVRYSEGTWVRVINSPFKFSRSAAGVRAAAPSLGEHNDLVQERISRSRVRDKGVRGRAVRGTARD